MYAFNGFCKFDVTLFLSFFDEREVQEIASIMRHVQGIERNSLLIRLVKKLLCERTTHTHKNEQRVLLIT